MIATTARKLLALVPMIFAGLAVVLGFYVAFTPKSLDDLDGPNWGAMSAAVMKPETVRSWVNHPLGRPCP
jgi:hypothetical protein